MRSPQGKHDPVMRSPQGKRDDIQKTKIRSSEADLLVWNHAEARMNLNKISGRCRFYKNMLESLDRYGGHGELVRGLMRLALFKPSNFVRHLRWKSICYHGVDRMILRFPGFSLGVDTNDDGISAELAIDRMHEPVGTEILVSVLRENMTIVDIGSNIGYFVMQEACRQKCKRILAIEPNPTSFALLEENVRLNHFEHVSLHNLAISDREGMLPFYISKQSNISSITPRSDYVRKMDVPVMTLDALVEKEQVEHVDLVRMDLEGHEIQVLRGMIETIRRDRPWICLEYHAPVISVQDRHDFVSTLESMDYELKCFTFRWSDCPIFGRTIIDRRNVIHEGQLREVLDQITSQVLLLFIAPKETPFKLPAF